MPEKIYTKLLCIFFVLICSSLSAQELYLQDGKVVSVEDVIKGNNPEEKISELDSLLSKTNKNNTEEKLRLLLYKATVYDDNYELEKTLSIIQKILDESVPKKLHRITCEANMLRVSVSMKNAAMDDFEKYLSITENQIKKYKFDDLYGMFYYYKATFHRLKNQLDSTIIYADKSLEDAQKRKNDNVQALAYTMLGTAYGSSDSAKAIHYFNLAIPYYKESENYTYLAMMYYNIAAQHGHHANIEKALLYCDSGLQYYDQMNYYYKEHLPRYKYELYKYIKNSDSALLYLEHAYNAAFTSAYFINSSISKELTERYESDKKETKIQKRNQQLILIIVISIVIIFASLLLFIQYRKIRKQNQKISTQNQTIQIQLEEQQKLLTQKQVLLSELQHRVKNNLQQVISILEIQKESIDFSNIDELVRANQNRIHSMALLHKKLNIAENINSIDFDHYIQELTDLVAESYFDENRNIKIYHQSSLGKTNIETALPLGLIIVELISNSLKHAFHHQQEGVIKISLSWNQELKKRQLVYSDNGSGFDFKPTQKKGLGVEIIEGLIDQINGEYEINASSGFSITINF